MKYLELFGHSWAIAWHHKSLWIISLLGIAINYIFHGLFVLKSPFDVIAALETSIAFLTSAFVSGALISMVDSIANKQIVTVSRGIRFGLRWTLPLTLVTVALMIPAWIMLAGPHGSWSTIYASSLGRPSNDVQVTDLLDYVGSAFSVIGPIVVVTQIMNAIGVGAERAVVLNGQSMPVALLRGFQILLTRLKDFTAIALVFLILGVAVSAFFSLVIGLLLNLLKDAYEWRTAIITLVRLLLIAVFQAFTSGTWTLAYRQWQLPKREIIHSPNL